MRRRSWKRWPVPGPTTVSRVQPHGRRNRRGAWMVFRGERSRRRLAGPTAPTVALGHLVGARPLVLPPSYFLADLGIAPVGGCWRSCPEVVGNTPRLATLGVVSQPGRPGLVAGLILQGERRPRQSAQPLSLEGGAPIATLTNSRGFAFAGFSCSIPSARTISTPSPSRRTLGQLSETESLMNRLAAVDRPGFAARPRLAGAADGVNRWCCLPIGRQHGYARAPSQQPLAEAHSLWDGYTLKTRQLEREERHLTAAAEDLPAAKISLPALLATQGRRDAARQLAADANERFKRTVSIR